jgi:hypothetical protein
MAYAAKLNEISYINLNLSYINSVQLNQVK